MSDQLTTILIADDQSDIRAALKLLFKGVGFRCGEASSPRQALQLAGESPFDLALIDLNYERDTTSGKEGLDLLMKLKKMDDPLPVVVMTAWGNVELAVEAMRMGACDFVEKPWKNDRLLTTVSNQLNLSRTSKRNRQLQAVQSLARTEQGKNLLAESVEMKRVLELIERVAPSDASILLTGENGTGKSLIAGTIHQASSRSDQSLVTVNMGGMSEGVFESEFFGHIKGAFTDARQDRIGRIEMAEGGTLFLDEIANAPASQQAKLLRVLETGEYEKVGSSKTRKANVRFICATNADLLEEVRQGRFRQDLLFRLNTVEIHIPPLRERKEDILPLARRFLISNAARYRKSIHRFSQQSEVLLLEHSWPGNVRELNHAVERAALLSVDAEIGPEDLGLRSETKASSLEDMSLEEVERYLIKRTLSRCGGNAREAANALGLSRSAFYRRLEKFGL